jgi:DNA-binding transcriptional MerR regulator
MRNEEFMSIKDAQVILGVSRPTIDLYAKRGLLKKYHNGITGYNIYLLKSEVKNLSERQQQFVEK